MEDCLTINKKIQIIQILRMVGATLVFLEHFFDDEFSLRIHFGGRLGVGIFFILSGFLLIYTDHENFHGYLRKKWIRICPLYWLTTLAVFIIGQIAPRLLSRPATPVHLIQSLLFIPYYSDGTIYPLNPVGWTLDIEIFVYLLYFGVAYLIRRIRGGVY